MTKITSLRDLQSAMAQDMARADALEQKREEARSPDNRLIFDCYNNMVFGELVVCPICCFMQGGFTSGNKDGALRLDIVEKGLRPIECQDCPRYDDGEEENGEDWEKMP